MGHFTAIHHRQEGGVRGRFINSGPQLLCNAINNKEKKRLECKTCKKFCLFRFNLASTHLTHLNKSYLKLTFSSA